MWKCAKSNCLVYRSLTKCYLGLNKMTEYTLLPAYLYAPGWRKYKCRPPAICASPTPTENGETDGKAEDKQAATVVDSEGPAGQRVVILFASVSGNTAKYAASLKNILSEHLPTRIINLSTWNPEQHAPLLERSVVIVMVCR